MPNDPNDVAALGGSAAYWEARIAAARDGSRDALGELFQRIDHYLRSRPLRNLIAT